MQLKRYQEEVLERLEQYLTALKEARKQTQVAKEALAQSGIDLPDQLRDYPRNAWGQLKEKNFLPGITRAERTQVPDHVSRTATSGEPIPHVCFKVPTGGGKTLLGVATIERIKQGTGFVLWIVPTKSIYQQTWDAFKNREHPYRQTLERASGGRVKLLRKDERFTKADIQHYLCVMVLMLPSANRDKNKEFLKIFRDSGGYASFFPAPDARVANRRFIEQHKDIETQGEVIKQSLINVLKILRPVVILDEAHKAYGKSDTATKEFVKAVNRLNPRFVLELSATPKVGISNVLVNIPGTALRDEEMIKLPVNIHNFTNSDWKYTLTQTKAKLDNLQEYADRLQQKENHHIRPIAVIRVERTGKNQRDGVNIHSEDARDYLEQLGVPVEQIKVKSSELDELAAENLLSPFSPVRYIITKDALKEGWDCSFAYILSLLDNTRASTAITQMVGRVMRQPHAKRTNIKELDECYVLTFNQKVKEAVENVRRGLQAEGMTGLDEYVHDGSNAEGAKSIPIKRRRGFRSIRIFLPQVLHEDDKGGQRLLDYDRDILSAINWGKIWLSGVVNLDDQDVVLEVKTTVNIHGDDTPSTEELDIDGKLELEFFVRRLLDVIPNPWQAMRVVKSIISEYRKDGVSDEKLIINRLYLSEVIRQAIKEKIDNAAKRIFLHKLKQGKISFYLETDMTLNFELERTFEVYVLENEIPLYGKHAQPLQRSLFEPIFERDFNGLEKDFALYLDGRDVIDWWHRVAEKQGYYLQGWRRHRMYPDFVACVNKDEMGRKKLLVLETKGAHLQGEDTEYKRELMDVLKKAYDNSYDSGAMRIEEPKAEFRILVQDEWREKLNEIMP